MATSSTARKRQAPDSTAADTSNRRQKRPPSKVKRFLRLLLLMLIIIAASVGATLYYTWPAGASLFSFLPFTSPSTETAAAPVAIETIVEETALAPVVEPTKPIFSRLDPFTVTISEGGSRSRILHVAITLQVADSRSDNLLTEYMPVVRDRVLRILAEQHPQYLQTPEGREQLVATLDHSLSQPFDARTAGPDITHVLFTAFVIQ